MELIRAGIDRLDDIMELYNYIIDNTVNMDIHARWKKGLHPSERLLEQYLKEGSMYILENDGEMIATMALTMEQSADYDTVKWGIDVKGDEAATVHILGINPKWQGKGFANQMLDNAIRIATANNKKTLRLDTLASNLPAQHMYERKGFAYRGTQNLYAENTGWTDFIYYEYLL